MSKKTKIIIALSISLVVILTVILLCIFLKDDKKYDTSSFHTVEVNDILQMFNDNKLHVIFIGYEKCDLCLELIPIMEKAQTTYGFMTNYLDLTKVDFESEDWQSLIEKFDMQVTQTTTEDGTGDSITDTFGNFLDKYGFTPTVIIIEDGKQKGGFIGQYKEEDTLKWFDYILNK